MDALAAMFLQQVVNQFLSVGLVKNTVMQIPVDIDVKESGGTAQAHGGSILLFDRCQIGEIEPLHRFPCVGRRRGYIESIILRHLFQFSQGLNLDDDVPGIIGKNLLYSHGHINTSENKNFHPGVPGWKQG